MTALHKPIIQMERMRFWTVPIQAFRKVRQHFKPSELFKASFYGTAHISFTLGLEAVMTLSSCLEDCRKC